MGRQLLFVLESSLLWWWSSIVIPSACLQNQTDRIALEFFKNSISEDAHGVLSSWNDSTHHCMWQGVLCGRRHQRVTSLDLSSRGLGGSLSPHIGNLSFLRKVSLHDNNFHGKIPPQIGNLLQLRVLILTDNSFGGPIPSNLSRCSSLSMLNLRDNQLVGEIHPNLGSLPKLFVFSLAVNNLEGPIPPSIGNLSLLQVLSLDNNALHGEIPEELSRLERLKYFELSLNKLTGEIPPGIFNISGIYVFGVGYNQLQGSFPSDIGTNLPSLYYLGASNNLFTGTIPSSLMNATSLGGLYLRNNSFHGPIPKNWGSLKDLYGISLGFNQLWDDLSFISSLANCSNLDIHRSIPYSIGALCSLQELSLAGNMFSREIPSSIGNITSLNLLDLSSNNFQGYIPQSLGNCKQLIGLDLSNNNLSGSLPLQIGSLGNLIGLDLSYNRLTGLIPVSISKCSISEQLCLEANCSNLDIHGSIPYSIGALCSLHELSLAGNMFSGEIPSSIGDITSLNLLDLSSNNFQGYIPQSLGNCKQLIGLDLSNNNLSGSLPLQVGSLGNLVRLDLSYNILTGLIPVSISKCSILEQLCLEANSFHGQIPPDLYPLWDLQELDLSNNKFSGPIPSFLIELTQLKYLNLSFNELEGQVPVGGVFLNASVVSVYGNRGLCGGAQGLKLPLCKLPSSKKSSSTKAIVISVVAVSLLCLALLFLSIFYYCKKKQTRTDTSMSLSFQHQFLRISYEELLRATNRFSKTNLIGKGRYSTVYKGILDGGVTVAVKVLNLMQRGASRSFFSECQTLGTIRHRNLLKILSVYSGMDFHGNDFKALIYEFMANESLEEWLHPRTIGRDDERGESRNLRLVQRLNIAIDIATAIEYLHKGCYPTIVHGDLKPSNVLLDNNMVARVGDFGLAKIISMEFVGATRVQDQSSSTSTTIRGSIGYVPPEYGMGHKASTLGDAYSYGILLLEMFIGKRPTEEAFGHHLNLHNFVRMALPDRAMDIVDLRLWNEAGDRQQEIRIRDCMISVFEVGVACSMESPPDRMDMTEAVRKLYSIKVSYETKERRTAM